MQPIVIYVPCCKCGNPDCDVEAMPERCRYCDHTKLPATVADRAELETAEWEG